jgi:hypothetical protein
VLHGVLRKLTETGTPFFCLTSMAATERTTRHKDFEYIGVAPFFRDMPTVFNKPWNSRGDDDLPFFVDSEWNTVHAFYPKDLRYTVEDSLDYYELSLETESDQERYQEYLEGYTAALSSVVPKGDVLCSLIDRGFLREPGGVIFVDDCWRNIRSMENACRFLGVPYLGILCAAYRRR